MRQHDVTQCDKLYQLLNGNTCLTLHLTTWYITQYRTTHQITHHTTTSHHKPPPLSLHNTTSHHITPYNNIPSPPTTHHTTTSPHLPLHTTTSHHTTPQHPLPSHSTPPHHTTQHNVLVSQFPGMNPAPMPWILWGPGLPPEITGDSAGSTAMTFTVSLTDFRNCRLWLYIFCVSIESVLFYDARIRVVVVVEHAKKIVKMMICSHLSARNLESEIEIEIGIKIETEPLRKREKDTIGWRIG